MHGTNVYQAIPLATAQNFFERTGPVENYRCGCKCCCQMVYSRNTRHKCSRLLKKTFQFIAPDLIFAEVGNILWKKNRSKELTFETATEILNDFKRLPIDIHESELLLDTAWDIATAYQCTIYDSLYVALAKYEKCVLVTADQALYTTLSKTNLSSNLLWIEDA